MGSRPSPTRARLALGWVALGLALAVMQGIWSVSMPPMASPDEPSHVVRAAAVARGQLGSTPGQDHSDPYALGPAATVQLPSDYVAASKLPTCYEHLGQQPASCMKPVPPATGQTVAVNTFAGQYPPLYYALVGWPSRFLSAVPAMYAMRLVSVVISSALFVWGLYRLRTVTVKAAWTWAAIAALTPMTLFMGSMVNPQALEISSAFAFWAACLALARSVGAPRRGAVVQAAVAGALLINTRTSGPVWALVIAVVALVLAPKGRLRALWGLRAIRWVLGVAAAAGVVATAWVVTHGEGVPGGHQFAQYASPLRVVRRVVTQTYGYFLEMIGNFGWLDTPSPSVTVLAWTVVVGTLLTVAIAAVSSRRVRAALLLSVVAVIVVPMALLIPTASSMGLIWQGRYTLPAAVGVPMVAAIALTSVAGPFDELVRRMVRWIAVPAIAVGHLMAFWWAMRRYSVGYPNSLVTSSPAWSSPLGYTSAVAIYAIPIAILAWAAWRSLRPTTTARVDARGAPAIVDELAAPVVV